jgi:hypothetical protein
MNNIYIVADLHLIYNSPFGVKQNLPNKTKINSRLNDQLNSLKKVVNDTISDPNAILFVFAGDTFDIPNPSKELRRMFFETISPLFHMKKDVIFILGNHEWSNLGKHPFSDISTLHKNYFHVVASRIGTEIKGKKVLFIPYGSLDTIADNDVADLMIGHVPVIGEKMNDHIKAREGLTKAELKKCFKLTRLGHFHTRSEFYIGGLCRRGYSDKNNLCGYEILNIDDLSIKHVEVPDRQFKEIMIDEKNISNLSIDTDKEDIVKIKIKGSKTFVKSLKYSSLWSDLECHKLLFDSAEITDTEKIDETMNIISIEDNIAAYGKDKKAGDKLINFGQRLFKDRNER